MITENSKLTEDTFQKNVSNTTKWLSDATAAMADTYNKQSRLSFDIYNKFMGSALKTDKENSNPIAAFFGFDMFRKNVEFFQKNIEIISSLTKEMMRTSVSSANKHNGSSAFSKDTTDTIMETYNKQMKQMADFNKNVFEMFSNQFRNTKIDFDSLTENLQKGMENNFDMSRESIKTILDSYNKQAGLVLEAEKKMLEEINHQIDLATKGSLKFWSELMDSVMNMDSETTVKKKEAANTGASHEAKKTATKAR